jgi:hypothetical protein
VDQYSKKVISKSGEVYKAFHRIMESDTEKEDCKKYYGTTECYFIENSSFTVLFDCGSLKSFMKWLKVRGMKLSGGTWKKEGIIK